MFEPWGDLQDGGVETRSIEDFPSNFEWNGKNFFIRGFLLCDRIHYTSIMRIENGWMHYDGMMAPPRFRIYPLGKGREAMRGRPIALIIYEITDKSINKLVGNPSAKLEEKFDIAGTDVTEVRSSSSSSRKNSISSSSDESSSGVELTAVKKKLAQEASTQRDVIEALMGLGREMTQATKEHKAGSPKKKPTWGFFRRDAQKRGQRPKCKGCNKSIDYSELCIKHIWKKQGLKHKNDFTYHCNVKCLSKLNPVHKTQFANMDWKGDKQMQNVADAMKKLQRRYKM